MSLKVKLYLLFYLLILIQFKVYSQVQKGMLMYKIENKQFKKTTFDKNRKIASYQLINVGSITENKGVFDLEIKVSIFNKKGKLQKEEISKYSCKIKEGNIFMGVFPFINKPSKKFDITVLTNNTLYPSKITTSMLLDDYRLAITYKTGLLGVSAKVGMDYMDRKISRLNTNTYIITGTIVMKIDVAGVNVSNVNYKSKETLNILKGIVFQKFVKENGAYFTIELVNK